MALPQDDWDQHWDDYSEATEENPAQDYRRRLILRRLGSRPSRIVDIGSGQGDLVKEIAARFPDAAVVGVEASQSGVDVSASKVPQATFIRRNLLEPAASLDLHREWATDAVCSEVLEHVDDPVALLRNSFDYMAPGCRVIVTVPGGPMSAFDRHIGHRRHYSVDSLRAVLEAAGLVVGDVSRAGFPFFNLYRLVIVARGDKLVDDVATGTSPRISRLGRLAMRTFRLLFHLNADASPWGWQLVASAHLPGKAP